ncbi:hypothetical protein A4R26_04715 [Niastella populi]|uniref:Uncharacterized protein n=1 Tax=Niastella populi TaxID=550983 RepID=A0A1V9FDK8_9BACT|nr:hypothetical protein A4R26_04715 [Niastella populi]
MARNLKIKLAVYVSFNNALSTYREGVFQTQQPNEEIDYHQFGFDNKGLPIISESDKNKQCICRLADALANFVGTTRQLSNYLIKALLKFKGLNI